MRVLGGQNGGYGNRAGIEALQGGKRRRGGANGSAMRASQRRAQPSRLACNKGWRSAVRRSHLNQTIYSGPMASEPNQGEVVAASARTNGVSVEACVAIPHSRD